MIIKASLKLKAAWETIFDFTILKDPISRYDTKRPTKCTMLQRNKNEIAPARARGLPRALLCLRMQKGMFNSEQKAKDKKDVAIKSCNLVELSFGQNLNYSSFKECC